MCWVLQLKSKCCDNVGMMQLKIYVVTTVMQLKIRVVATLGLCSLRLCPDNVGVMQLNLNLKICVVIMLG